MEKNNNDDNMDCEDITGRTTTSVPTEQVPPPRDLTEE